MYVFAPGVGCTGPTKLVRPGDELIFNSSYNPQDWSTDMKAEVEPAGAGIALTCPAREAPNSREFKLPLPQ